MTRVGSQRHKLKKKKDNHIGMTNFKLKKTQRTSCEILGFQS
jgi:hypothetical protein